MSLDLPSPWNEFLAEVDRLVSEPCRLHCIGSFAAVAAYQLPRSTNDLDDYSLVPRRHFVQSLFASLTAALKSFPLPWARGRGGRSRARQSVAGSRLTMAVTWPITSASIPFLNCRGPEGAPG